MASALQKLFRKRISKQQIQEQRQKQEAAAAAEIESRRSLSRLGTLATQPYLTVSSLNSPSSSTSHFPFSSKLSLDLYSTLGSGADLESTSPQRQDRCLSREESSSGSSHLDSRPQAATVNSHSMLRNYADSGRGWRALSFTEGEPQVDQFGSLLQADRDSGLQTHGKDEEDEEELDCNPVYNAVSQRQELQHDWNMAKLVLMPSKQHNIASGDLASEEYLALHTLLPSNLFKDQYVSVRSTLSQKTSQAKNPWVGVVVTATLEAESRSVSILVTKSAGTLSNAVRWEHNVAVLGETTVYRSTNKQQTANVEEPSGFSFRRQKQPAANTRKERVRVRVLTIDGLVIPDALLAVLTQKECPPERAERRDNKLGMERSVSGQTSSTESEGAIAFPKGSPQLSSSYSDNSRPTSPTSPKLEKADEACLIPLRRQFLADFAFLLNPPQDLHRLQKPLQEALETLLRAADEFTNAYVYVSGFDSYNVSRIRRGILCKAWQAFESCKGGDNKDELPGWSIALLGSEGRARLLLLLENVVMGYCHGKIYSSIRIVYKEADEAVDSVICTYQELQVTLDDLGVGVPVLCKRPDILDKAIFIMKHLGDADEDMEHFLNGGVNPVLVRMLAQQGDLFDQSIKVINRPEYTPERSRGRIRTPLDVFDVLHATLEEIGSAITKAQKGAARGALGTDELLPILAYVIIRAGPMKLVSLFYYTRQFGLSDAISSQLK